MHGNDLSAKLAFVKQEMGPDLYEKYSSPLLADFLEDAERSFTESLAETIVGVVKNWNSNVRDSQIPTTSKEKSRRDSSASIEVITPPTSTGSTSATLVEPAKTVNADSQPKSDLNLVSMLFGETSTEAVKDGKRTFFNIFQVKEGKSLKRSYEDLVSLADSIQVSLIVKAANGGEVKPRVISDATTWIPRSPAGYSEFDKKLAAAMQNYLAVMESQAMVLYSQGKLTTVEQPRKKLRQS